MLNRAPSFFLHISHFHNYKLMKEANRGKQMKSVSEIKPPETWEKKFGKRPLSNLPFHPDARFFAEPIDTPPSFRAPPAVRHVPPRR